ncbi:MAG: ComEA family DNA-binding protein [Candidatus Eremiobacteraeota bacterium]|nr:ComEA family DNA-binding protein [Candidatus Eremiobacteraeota bacterium]
MLVLAIVLVAAILLRHPAAPIVAQNASIEGARPKTRSQQSASPTILVYVSGSVARPGLFRMNASSRVNEAVSRAGGMLPGADSAGVNLAAVLEDGQQINVAKIGEKKIRGRATTRSRRLRKKGAHPAPTVAAVDLNTADAVTLEQLPGIGAELAERLIAYRRMNGPFRSVDDLADVAGMTQRRIDALVPFLRDFQQR